MQLSAHQLINQNSGNVEWYTPSAIVEAARQTVSAIDLDPASSEIANQTVQATQFYTSADNGLMQPWLGRVWLNHPFGRKGNAAWIGKLVAEYERGNVTAACCITYASTSEAWYRPLLAYPMCFLHGRTKFIDPTNRRRNSPSKGCTVAYLGNDVGAFTQAFAQLGTIKI